MNGSELYQYIMPVMVVIICVLTNKITNDLNRRIKKLERDIWYLQTEIDRILRYIGSDGGDITN